MAESFSFDVVSDFERQELVNTLDQVKREISQRYDLKDTDTKVDLDKENIFIITNSELTLNAVNDIIRQKAIKRNLSLKIFDYGEIEMVSGNRVKQTILLKQGIKQEIAKKISKDIRDQIKKINVSINGETLRVASKSKNDLQLAIKLVSQLEESLNIPLFVKETLDKIKENNDDQDFFSAIKLCKKKKIGPHRSEDNRPIFFNAYPAVRPDTPAPITAIFLNTRLP